LLRAIKQEKEKYYTPQSSNYESIYIC